MAKVALTIEFERLHGGLWRFAGNRYFNEKRPHVILRVARQGAK